MVMYSNATMLMEKEERWCKKVVNAKCKKRSVKAQDDEMETKYRGAAVTKSGILVKVESKAGTRFGMPFSPPEQSKVRRSRRHGSVLGGYSGSVSFTQITVPCTNLVAP